MSRALPRCAVLACASLALCGSAEATAARPLPLRARAAILLERDTGDVVYSRRAHTRLRIASTTKLMTALVTLEHARLDRRLKVLPYSATGAEVTADLPVGTRVAVRDLLRAMLLPSAGDAANALAVGIAGSVRRFVRLMNARAHRLQLRETHYSTPVGLDTPGNYSTAADLAKLADRLLRVPFFATTVARRRALLPSAGSRAVVNRNDLVGRYRYVIGVKTGHTHGAGYCLVGAGRRRGATLISVVLGDPSEGARDADTLALLRYGLALYHSARPIRAGAVYARVPVSGRLAQPLELVAAHDLSLVIRQGARLVVFTQGVPSQVRGPLPARTQLGWVVVRDGARIARVPLLSAVALAAPPPAASQAWSGGRLGGVAAALAVLGCSLGFMFVRRRGRSGHDAGAIA
jgi:D-alanyl-D-alanine carboxypeptidase (penicillin-binding protein 5/6)